jgi:hypothetical protein
VIIRALVIWFVMMGAEVVHGALRALLLVPLVGDFRARQIGVFIGSLIVVAIAYAFVSWMGAQMRRALLAVGVGWTILTLGFEVMLGRVMLGASWERIASDYRLDEGGLMPLGLMAMALAPLLAARMRERRSRALRAPARTPV